MNKVLMLLFAFLFGILASKFMKKTLIEGGACSEKGGTASIPKNPDNDCTIGTCEGDMCASTHTCDCTGTDNDGNAYPTDCNYYVGTCGI